jgi:fatty-acyl-CoA synthase
MRPHHRFWPSRLPYSLLVPETTLVDNLDVSARRYPDRDAICFLGTRITFRELKREVDALAGWLQRVAAVARGDRVLLMMQNSPQFVIGFYAVLRAGAVVVPINPMNRAEELRHYIADSGARVAIAASDLAGQLMQADASLPEGERLAHLLVARYADMMPPPGSAAALAEPLPAAWVDWLLGAPATPPGATNWTDAIAQRLEPMAVETHADDLAVLPYTSGTTGFPKGCMHSHRSIMHNVLFAVAWGPLTADAVGLAVVPMFHITGMLYGMHTPIYIGSTAIQMPRWDREFAAAQIARHRITHWTNIPTMVIDLLGSPNVAQFDLSSLRVISGGGAPMPHAVAERLRESFGLTYCEGYGLTETAAPSHSNPPDRPKLQCLGVPIASTDSRVIDPVDLHELPPGEVGEIIVCGPQVFQGYWRNPEATASAFMEFEGRRFFRTGDLGRTDEDGYFFITDRLKRMINASGFKIWPAEVELLMFKHPAIQEACVISHRDAYRGETVKAVVVLRPEARGRTTAEQIVEWSRENMAAYKVPRLVEFVDVLPKSGTGKVMWRALQERENQQPG